MFYLLSIANPETKTWFLVVWDLVLEERVLTVYFPFYLKFYLFLSALILLFYFNFIRYITHGHAINGFFPPFFCIFKMCRWKQYLYRVVKISTRIYMSILQKILPALWQCSVAAFDSYSRNQRISMKSLLFSN